VKLEPGVLAYVASNYGEPRLHGAVVTVQRLAYPGEEGLCRDGRVWWAVDTNHEPISDAWVCDIPGHPLMPRSISASRLRPIAGPSTELEETENERPLEHA
jgi:hypothetical protein